MSVPLVIGKIYHWRISDEEYYTFRLLSLVNQTAYILLLDRVLGNIRVQKGNTKRDQRIVGIRALNIHLREVPVYDEKDML